MIKIDLTLKEKLLVQRVCDLQLASFEKILSGNHESVIREKLIQHHVTESELNNMIVGVVSQYRDIKNSPSTLFQVHTDLLGNFREALEFNSESLKDFKTQITSLQRRIDLAIYILDSVN
jgi:hypothetical protein